MIVYCVGCNKELMDNHGFGEASLKLCNGSRVCWDCRQKGQKMECIPCGAYGCDNAASLKFIFSGECVYLCSQHQYEDTEYFSDEDDE